MFGIFFTLFVVYIIYISYKKSNQDKGTNYYMAGQKPKYGENTQSKKTTLSKEITKENYKENYTENYIENYEQDYKEDYSKKVECVHTDKAHIKEVEDLKNKINCLHDEPGYTGDKFDTATKNNNNNVKDRSYNPVFEDNSTDGIKTYGDRKADIVELVSGAKVTFGNEDDDDDPIKMK